ncbi:MAG: hypothetical protein ABI841_01695 [Chloroflexota bacterium]
MRRQGWCAAVVGGVAVLLAGCQSIIGTAPVADPAVAGMGCEQSERFLFSGETSLAALGLDDDFGSSPDAQRIGMIWVTAEPVNMMGPGPIPAGTDVQFERMVCVQWPDGSGMAGPLPPDWELPATIDLDAPASATATEPPVVLIGLIVAVALIGAVSFFAFRSEPR